MKATELIAQLQKIVDEHGDLTCFHDCGYGAEPIQAASAELMMDEDERLTEELSILIA